MQLIKISLLPASLLRLLLGLTLGFNTAALASEHFPRPPELEPDINFWVRVYTKVDTNSGFIHDADNLAVVYQTLSLTRQPAADNTAINAAKTLYAGILKRLASGRGGLSAEEQRVLALWGPDVSGERLRRAADNIRFQRGQSDRFKEGLARSGEWRDHILKVLGAGKLPPELAVLPHVESSFNPEAYSSAGAAGIWQFTRSTGQRYLHIDYEVDERLDPYAASAAAAQLLKHNYQLTGTWPLALTAYNHGSSGIRRATRELGSTDIATIVRKYKGPTFGFASRNFYVSFLAAMQVSSDPGRYFGAYKSARPVNYAEVKTADYLQADAFARAFNTDLATLKRHNRALLNPVWDGKKRIPKGYTMRVPSAGMSLSPEKLLASIPANQRFGAQIPDLFHKVAPGDTVSGIAARYGHSMKEIAGMNNLNSRYGIRAGQVLRLPLGDNLAGARTVARAAPATAGPAVRPPIRRATPAAPPREPAAAVATRSGAPARSSQESVELIADPSDYTVASDNSIEVQAAETLGHYAHWLDLQSSQLRRVNGMGSRHSVVIGHRLKLDFSRVNPEEFEHRRLLYQQDMQQAFFSAWHISATSNHIIAAGDSLWILTQRKFKVPLWLLRQYNPDLDLDKLKPGTVIVIPQLVAV